MYYIYYTIVSGRVGNMPTPMMLNNIYATGFW